MKKVAVTGGSGGAGHFVIMELLANGYTCVNVDMVAPKEELCPFIKVDLNDYQAVHAALAGCDGIVHFAANPHPDENHIEAADRFANNTTTLYNVFNAAREHGIKRVVWASSETVFGYPFENNLPPKLPIDESLPKAPQNGYALSKAICENLAEQMAALYDMSFVGLRLSNVLYDDPTATANFQDIPSYWDDMGKRMGNLWCYIDARDTARACRLGLEANTTGAEVFGIAATDTIMKQPTRELAAAIMPSVPIDAGLTGRQSTMDGHKAKVMLGFEAEHTWQTVLGLNQNGEPA